MAVTNKHSLFAVEFNTTLVGGITAQRIYLGDEVRSEPTSGEIYGRHIAVVQRRPGATFSTLAVAAGLAQIPLACKDIAALAAGLKLYAQKHADGGGRTAGAAHRVFTIVQGMICPRRLSCDHGADASLDAEALATYDGVNDPIVETDATALPSGITDAERFTIGKTTVGGILLTHMKGMTIDFGVTVELEAADSDIYPIFASVMRIQPVLTFRGIDLEWLKSSNVPRAGLVCTPANTIFYLRKRTQDGASFVADITAEHVKFTAAGIAVIDEPMNATGQAGAEANLRVICKYDGTANSPLAVTTASAIT